MCHLWNYGFHSNRGVRAGAQLPASGGVTRKILSQVDGHVPGYATIIMDVTTEAGVPVARHTHPGIESSYVLEGGRGEAKASTDRQPIAKIVFMTLLRVACIRRSSRLEEGRSGPDGRCSLITAYARTPLPRRPLAHP